MNTWDKSKPRFWKITVYSHTGLELKSWEHIAEFDWLWDYSAIKFKNTQSKIDMEDFQTIIIKEGIILIEEEITKNVVRVVKEISYCKCLKPDPCIGSPIDTVDSCKLCGKIIKGSNI